MLKTDNKPVFHWRNAVLFGLLLAVLWGVLVSQKKRPRAQSVLDTVLIAVAAPVQKAVIWAVDGVAFTWRQYIALINVAQENVLLRHKLAQAQAELAANKETLQQAQLLRDLLDAQSARASVQRSIYAKVIAVTPSALFRSVRINKGSRAGIRPGSPVITHKGLVGRVVQVSARAADVMLLADANSSVSAMVQRTRARARVLGTGSDSDYGIEIKYLRRRADVDPGDILVTSGLGGTFPQGLPVARVVAVERPAYGLFQNVQAAPTVDFARLESVLVLHPENRASARQSLMSLATDASLQSFEVPQLWCQDEDDLSYDVLFENRAPGDTPSGATP